RADLVQERHVGVQSSAGEPGPMPGMDALGATPCRSPGARRQVGTEGYGLPRPARRRAQRESGATPLVAPPKEEAPRPLLADAVLEALTGLEGGVLAGRDLDLLGRAGLDAGAGLALADLEGAEAGQLHLVVVVEARADRAQHGVHDFLDVLLLHARGLRDLIDEIGLGNGLRLRHANPPRYWIAT